MDQSTKRRVAARGDEDEASPDSSSEYTPALRSLSHPISPPRKRARVEPKPGGQDAPKTVSNTQNVRSPVQLTWIRDLPSDANVDAVTLKDILGDPLIAECWEFNYLHDIDFLMSAFDQDVRHLVKVHIVHGFWKREDPSRAMLIEQASNYKNVELHTAFMPEMFGTHHSKMMILLRHDETAQVIIHTANMIPRDWRNLTQGMWRSPLLPLQKDVAGSQQATSPIGSGEKSKIDLLNYLRAYDIRRQTCKPLVEQLKKHDFSAIRAALVASVPGRHSTRDDSPTRWGWAAIKQCLRSVPVQGGKAEVVVQISSIATLGPTDNWVKKTMFGALSAGKGLPTTQPTFKVVFPTADEIRRSLDGYESGGSIHTKIDSPQQAKQLIYLKPLFHHWANDAPEGTSLKKDVELQEAGRKRAAPHIKTYVRYGETGIDWALLTSANLSKQAWGDNENTVSGEVRIASWEIGVLVWPSLYAEGARMVPTFQTDSPPSNVASGGETVVGFRLPYNLPLQPYGPNEKPWVATATYAEPDWKGQRW